MFTIVFCGTLVTYDANGIPKGDSITRCFVKPQHSDANTTQKGTQQFSYNFRNQLVRATSGGNTFTLKYDPFGRRIEKSGSGNTIRFYYSGNQVIEERNGSDQVLKNYVWGNGIDELLRMDKYSGNTPTPYYFHTNDIGSTTAITDANGALVERVSYDTFGMPSFTNATGQAVAASTIGNTILFQGHTLDFDLNLYDYRNRWYDPIMGRFTTIDSLGYHDSMNLYQGMNMNPGNYVDPMGLYNYDFHYYVIYNLMRARGWGEDESEMVAGFSQYVDDSDASNPGNPLNVAKGIGLVPKNVNEEDPIFYFHFHGWWDKTVNVSRDNGRVRNIMYRATDAFSTFKFDNEIYQKFDDDAFERLGVSLHIYADTWAHETHKAPLGHFLEGEFHSTYDDRINADVSNSEKALDAAKAIYEWLPESINKNNKKMTWGELEPLLKKAFAPEEQSYLTTDQTNEIVAIKLIGLFNKKYGTIKYDVSKFKRLDEYYRKLLKKYFFRTKE